MILITRPKNESYRLKDEISSLGFDVHVKPLSQFKLKKNTLTVNKKTIIMISSPRAAKFIIQSSGIIKSTPLLIIGKSSYIKLNQSGFSNIIHTSKNSDDMFSYLKKNLLIFFDKRKFDRLLYLTGSVFNKSFVRRLEEMKIKKIIVYETIFIKKFDSLTIKLIQSQKIKVCLLFSQANAKYFVKLLQFHNLQNFAQKIIFLSLSKNISQIMINAGFENSICSKQPSQKSLIDKLKKLRV